MASRRWGYAASGYEGVKKCDATGAEVCDSRAMSDTLFPLPPPEPPRETSVEAPAPRLERANRHQLELRATDLDGLLPPIFGLREITF